jgi:lysozyme family protein
MTSLFQPAFDFVMSHEDRHRTGKVTYDAGGKTRFGLAQRYNPDLTDENFYALPLADGLVKAATLYASRYWNPYHLAQLAVQVIASKICDMIVNPGPYSVKLVQGIAGVALDGVMGPLTIGKLNLMQSGILMTLLCEAQADYYHDHDSENTQLLNALLVRAADKPQGV